MKELLLLFLSLLLVEVLRLLDAIHIASARLLVARKCLFALLVSIACSRFVPSLLLFDRFRFVH